MTPIAPIAEFLDGTSTPTPRAIADNSERLQIQTVQVEGRGQTDQGATLQGVRGFLLHRGSRTDHDHRSGLSWTSIMMMTMHLDNQAEIIRELRQIIRQRDTAYAEMFAQGQDYITNMESAAQLEINYLIHEVKKRDSALEQQASLMEAMSQEDEGATYRIEELTRMRNLSEQVAEHINARYQQLNNAYQEQRL